MRFGYGQSIRFIHVFSGIQINAVFRVILTDPLDKPLTSMVKLSKKHIV